MKSGWLAPFVWTIIGRPVVWLTRTRLIGVENIPKTGAVLAGNHVSYMDPVLLWASLRQPVYFMAKVELWQNRFLAWALPRLRAFPVNRGEADRTAISTATDVLKAGGYVGIFPEGTRSADGAESLGLPQGGAAFIAFRAGVPVVPVAFAGTEKVWPRGAKLPRLGKVTIGFGEPIDPESIAPDAGRKERVTAVTAAIMEGIARELAAVKGVVR